MTEIIKAVPDPKPNTKPALDWLLKQGIITEQKRVTKPISVNRLAEIMEEYKNSKPETT